MADREALRKTDEAIVVSTLPDICLTPIGGVMVPVPYTIIARFGAAVRTDANVRMNGLEAFVLASRIPNVEGDDAGVGGGVVSGVNLGYCRPVGHSSSVRAGKEFVVQHSAEFWMNCDGPEGTGNTRGRAILLKGYDLGEMASDNPVLADNFPYSDDVFERIEEMSGWIDLYARRYGVPPGAVAGGIADELNTRTSVDWVQDALIDSLPNSYIKDDTIFYFDNKLLNAFKNDLGPGNIKLETAWDLYKRHPDSFPVGWNYADMVDYVLTDRGTAQLSALYVSDAKRELGPLIQGLEPELQEAVLVTAYKRGIERYEPSLRAALESRPFRPGEGLRYLLQRDRVLDALGSDEGASERRGGVKVSK